MNKRWSKQLVITCILFLEELFQDFWDFAEIRLPPSTFLRRKLNFTPHIFKKIGVNIPAFGLVANFCNETDHRKCCHAYFQPEVGSSLLLGSNVETGGSK